MSRKTLVLLAGERAENESDKAVQACNDFLRLGSGRTMSRLHQKYAKIRKNTPPTSSFETLKAWGADFSWQERAAAYDAEVEAQKNEARAKSMESTLALDFKRVDKLKKLAAFLEKQMYQTDDDGNFDQIWLPDVKQIGSGEFAEKVDIVRFNASLVREFRETLNDLALETGGRKRSDKNLNFNIDVTDLSDQELEAIIHE